MAPAWVTTRSISMVSDGTSAPCASMMTGTRRMMPSVSGLIENSPRPAAACLDRQHVAQQAGKRHQVRRRIGPADGKAGLQRHLGLRSRRRRRRADLADDDARLLDRVGQHVVIARQAVELGARFVIDAAKTLLGDRRRHAVRLGENDVETDSDGAELGDAGDQIGHGRARPRPLPDRLEACLVDIDDDDRPRSSAARGRST